MQCRQVEMAIMDMNRLGLEVEIMAFQTLVLNGMEDLELALRLRAIHRLPISRKLQQEVISENPGASWSINSREWVLAMVVRMAGEGASQVTASGIHPHPLRLQLAMRRR